MGILSIFLSVGEGWARLEGKADGRVILVEPFGLQVTEPAQVILGVRGLDLHQGEWLEMRSLQEGGPTSR